MDSKQANPPAGPDDKYQQQFNEGQIKINGQLVMVDQTLIEILRLIRIALMKVPKLAKDDFAKIDELLKKVYHASKDVAHVKPPGCEPAYPPDPNWRVLP
jgi:hypothetical protein